MPSLVTTYLSVELGADDHDGVEALAAVDADRGVHGVLDEVAALAGVDGRELGLRDEAADDERVVAGVAVELQHGEVAEHLEGVVAGAAVHGGRHRTRRRLSQPRVAVEEVGGRDAELAVGRPNSGSAT